MANVQASQRNDGSKLVDIQYDLTDGIEPMSVSILVSNDNGATWEVTPRGPYLSGDIGTSMTNGLSKAIVWDAGADVPEVYWPETRVKVIAQEAGETRTVLLPGDVPLALVRIPAGSFTMGSPDGERSRDFDEGPTHTVTIAYGYYLGKTEVTQRQWLALMGSWPGTPPSQVYGLGDDYPAYDVSWNDARDFVTSLNLYIVRTEQGPLTVRIPSEAEWEYACRAGTQTRFYFGDSLGCDDVGDCAAGTLPGLRSDYMWYGGNNTPSGTKLVATKLANQFGLHDMSGNVWEWCEDDWYRDYTGAPTDGSAWGDGTATNRVFRGGEWQLSLVSNCRSACRGAGPPSFRSEHVGFRLAAGPPPGTRTVLLPGGVTMDLVRITSGSFVMGSPDTERSASTDEGPTHTVTIAYDFYMGRTEVTQAQWLAVMGSWPGTEPSSIRGLGDDYPAYYVSWDDAQDLITSLNAYLVLSGQGPLSVRLPSEAEWEYACRAGTQTRFCFGDSLGCDDNFEDCAAGVLPGNRSDYMWYGGNNTPNRPKEAATKLANQFGLHNMHGNLREWCQDDHHVDYTGAPTNGSAWGDGTASSRVVRGGYYSYGIFGSRSANRSHSSPSSRQPVLSFRVAAD